MCNHAIAATQSENELSCITAAIAGLKERAERAEAVVERLRGILSEISATDLHHSGGIGEDWTSELYEILARIHELAAQARE